MPGTALITKEVAGQYCLAIRERSDSSDRCDCACDAGEAGNVCAGDCVAVNGGA
jgi:hypothetical protein